MSAVEAIVARRPPSVSENVSDWDRDSLHEAFQDGRLSGMPVEGAWADALFEVFARLGLTPDACLLAETLPRKISSFGRRQMIETLDRLGIEIQARRISRHEIGNLPAAAIIVDQHGRPVFPDHCSGGDRADRPTPDAGRIRQSSLFQRSFEVLVPRSQANRADLAPRGAGGSLAQRLRVQFGPELRLVAYTTMLSYALIITASLSIGYIFDAVLPAGAMDTLVALTVGIFVIGALDLALGWIRARMLSHLTGRIDASTRGLTYSKLLDLPPEMISAVPDAEQIERMRQFAGLRDQFSGPLVTLCLELPLSVTLLAAMAILSPKLAGFAFLCAAVFALVALLLAPRLRVTRQRAIAARAAHSRILQEAIGSREQLLRRGLGPTWMKRLSELDADFETHRSEEEAAWRLMTSAGAALTPLAIGSVVFIGALDAMNGALTPGALVAITVLSARIFLPLQQALAVALRLPEILSLVRQIDRMLQLPEERSTRNSIQVTLPETNQPLMTIETVSLQYPGSRRAIFSGLRWQVPKGAYAALTASSGVGKTSLLMLLSGRIRPSSGSLRLAGINLAQIDSSTRAQLIGFAGPTCVPLSCSVAENLRLRCPDASNARLHEVCAELGLDRDLECFAGGLEAEIGIEVADRMTPSFRTRLALARLLLAPPPLLLLDEPENGLSPSEEKYLLAAIRRRLPELTCIMVTQRPAFMRAADAVFELTAQGLKRCDVSGRKEAE